MFGIEMLKLFNFNQKFVLVEYKSLGFKDTGGCRVTNHTEYFYVISSLDYYSPSFGIVGSFLLESLHCCFCLSKRSNNSII